MEHLTQKDKVVIAVALFLAVILISVGVASHQVIIWAVGAGCVAGALGRAGRASIRGRRAH